MENNNMEYAEFQINKEAFLAKLTNPAPHNMVSIWFRAGFMDGNMRLNDFTVQINKREIEYGEDDGPLWEDDEPETYLEYTLSGKDEYGYENSFTFNEVLITRALPVSIDESTQAEVYHIKYLNVDSANNDPDDESDLFPLMFCFGRKTMELIAIDDLVMDESCQFTMTNNQVH